EGGDVLLYTLIGVVDGSVKILAAVIRLLVQPVAQQLFVQPDAPAYGKGILHIEIEQGTQHMYSGQNGKQQHGAPESGLVQLLQCGVHGVVPVREQDFQSYSA